MDHATIASHPDFPAIAVSHRRADELWESAQAAASELMRQIDFMAGDSAAEWAAQRVGETVWLRGSAVRIVSVDRTTVTVEHDPVIPGTAGQLEHVADRDIRPQPDGLTLGQRGWNAILEALRK